MGRCKILEPKWLRVSIDKLLFDGLTLGCVRFRARDAGELE
jgi:hypothetical protein